MNLCRYLWAVLAVFTTATVHGQSHGDESKGGDAQDMPGMFMNNSTMQMVAGPLGIPMSREASGTSWLPDTTPMYAIHGAVGSWQWMFHENAFLQYMDTEGTRGDEQFGSINWFMGMASRQLGGGNLTLRTMVSAEPITVGNCGYPDLLATGESCKGGQQIHDRQHPHDLFMEIAASYEHELTSNLAFQLYGGPVGEPALGPTAYPHRISSLANPIAPIGHHWLDATHISFGVVTAGLFGHRWKLEASAFNGREPDENRYDIDTDRLDSYSGRFSFLPNANWVIQISNGRLKEAEPARNGMPAKDVTRTTVSATYHLPLANGGTWASTAAWGRNDEMGESTNAYLMETNLNLAERNLLFGRAELTQKSGETLVLNTPAFAHRIFNVSTVSIGYARQFSVIGNFVPAIGVSVGISLVPYDLETFYGSRNPKSYAIFVSLRPKRRE